MIVFPRTENLLAFCYFCDQQEIEWFCDMDKYSLFGWAL